LNKNFDLICSEVINTINRRNDYILGEIGTGTRKQGMTENSNQRQPMFCCDVKQVLAPSE